MSLTILNAKDTFGEIQKFTMAINEQTKTTTATTTTTIRTAIILAAATTTITKHNKNPNETEAKRQTDGQTDKQINTYE